MGNYFKKTINYLGKENRLLVFTMSFLFLFSMGVYALAAGLYAPGDTNDPSCAPGDAGCYVEILPSQSGHSGEILTTNGTAVSWTAAGSGTVSSVATDATLTGGTITSTGTLGLNLSNANTWAAQQTFGGTAPIFSTLTTNGGIFYGNGSGLLQQTGAGTANQVLHGGTSPSYSAVSLTADVSGTLPVANGGTGLSSAGSGYQILGMNGSGALEYKTVGGDLSLSGSTFTIANDAITTAKILNNAVTYAKMQAVSTTSKLLGSSSTTTAVQEITLGSGLSMSGTTLSNSGVVSIGAVDGTTKDATNGLAISGGVLYAQSADLTNPGLVTISTQTFNGVKTFDDGLDAGGDIITSVGTPSASTDAANKAYVDGLVSGLNWKVSVNAATTTNLPLSPTYNNGTAGVGAYLEGGSNGALGAIDGVTLTTSQRLLVKDETGGNEPYNGVYIVTTVGDGSTKYKLTRCTSCDQPSEFSNAAVAVLAGTANTGTAWTQTNTITTVGTDAVAWVQFLSNAYSEGSGIDITSGVVSVDFSTVTGTLGLTRGGTGLSSAGSGYQILGMNGSGALEYKTVGGDLSLSGSTFTIANDAITTAKILNNAVTYAKMQAVSTTSKLLGSSSTTTAVQEITLGSGLSMSGTTLSVTAGSGTVTSVATDATLTGGTITSTGTLGLNLSNSNTWVGQQIFSTTAPRFSTFSSAGGIFYGNGTGVLQQVTAGTSGQVLHGGSSPSFSAVSLTADVSGTLPIANGGTGQTTAVAAFDAISGMSAAGDLIYGGASGTRSRLALGSAGQCLVVSGSAPIWSSCSASGGVTAVATVGSTPAAAGASISGTTLTLQPANGTHGGVLSNTTQTIAGVKTFSSNVKIGTGTDLIIAGYGTGSVTTNTVFGVDAGSGANTGTGFNNWFGYNAGYRNTSGSGNTGIGENAGNAIVTGNYNTVVGDKAMSNSSAPATISLAENTVIGASAGNSMTAGAYNLLLGTLAGDNLTTGLRNIVLATYNGTTYGGATLSTGSANVYIGGWDGMGATDSNRIALSDGAGNLRMYSDSTGTNFGGDLSPNALLSVGNTSQFQVNTSGAISTSGGVTFSGLSSAAATGYVCITTASGVLSYHATACGTSSERFKHNIATLTGNLEKVLSLRPVSYISNFDDSNQVGFIAEEVHGIEPRLVTFEEDGTTIHGLNYAQFAPLLAGAIKDLNAKLTDLDDTHDGSLASLIRLYLESAFVRVRRFAVGSSDKPAGITLYDTVTKQPYCLTITNGVPVSTAGECPLVSSNSTPVVSSPSGNESSGGENETPSSSEEDVTTDVSEVQEEEVVSETPSSSEDVTTDVLQVQGEEVLSEAPIIEEQPAPAETSNESPESAPLPVEEAPQE